MKKLLDTYKEDQLENTDKRLIRGLYQRKLKDYEEDGALEIKKRMISLLKGKGVQERDVVTPPPHLVLQNSEMKEYSEGILNIVNKNDKRKKLKNKKARESMEVTKSSDFENAMNIRYL